MSHTFSYWEQDSFLKSWDLIVIGAGIVGLSAAHFYLNSRPEARVLVLEKGFIPEGASTRNAGFACMGSIGEHLADLEKSSEQEVRQRIKRRYDGLQLLIGTLG
ncbi:MAG: FAD-dependent oxidoreductase, partial [Saprospiraceae bacterium]|nr:FAD-dependent oxidoreductase [Saprospiraceae bacterium]